MSPHLVRILLACAHKSPYIFLQEECVVRVQKERAIFWWGVIATLTCFWTFVATIVF
jgi:hypothetical protein